uniref:Integrase catalytic domain-containing protein n=1 Tax=Fagus sylvatica TaxID=28930 RepID=A0A2N9F2E7_FAGSY
MEAHSTNSPNSPAQSPLLLLNHMSNLMSAKLDSTNYMIWKVQITAILDAYSMLDHIDGSIPQPREFLISESGVPSVNPAFLAWKKRDKAFLTLLYSTLSSPVIAMVVGKNTSQEVWNTLEERFTSTARSNVLNLKLELQSIKKGGNESITAFLQRIKTVRDKLSAVGVPSDHEELIHVILKGLPKEYAPFASAIRTRDGVLSLEKLSVLLQTEEQSLNETSDSLSNSALAMFVSQNKPSNGFNGNQSYHRGRGRNNYTRGRGGRSSNFNHNSNFTPSHPPQPQQSQVSQFTSQGRTERPTCQICWKIGHYAIDCYHRMDFAYQGKNPTTKLAAMASASNLHHNQNTETWLTDSGASDHITASANNLNPQVPYQGQEQVSVGNGQNLPIQHIGNTHLHTKFHKFQLRNVLHVPRIASNLLSVHKLCLHNNCSCYFDANKLLVQDIPTGRLLYKGLSNNGVYPIQSSLLLNSAVNKRACVAQSASSEKWNLWHSRLCHPSAQVLNTIFPSLSSCNPLHFQSTKLHCKHCLAGKMHQLSFSVSNKRVTAPFALVHSDLWGPAPVQSSTGFKYYLVLVDEFTKFFELIVGGNSPQINSISSVPPKALFTKCHVLTHHSKNGVAERKHRHLIQCALALLSESNLPMSHWHYAVSTAAHVINRLPTPNLSSKSPWEVLFHTSPDLTHLRAFGCQCFPLLTPYTAHKLYPKTTPCVFLGYPTTSKGYLCFDPIAHRLYTSRHVLFNESVFPGLKHASEATAVATDSHKPISLDLWLNTPLSSCSLLPNVTATDPLSAIESVLHTSIESETHLPTPKFSHLPNRSNASLQLFTATPDVLPLHTSPSHINTDTPISSPNITSSPSTLVHQSASPSVPNPVSNIPIVPIPPPIHSMQTRSKNGIFKPKLGYIAKVDYSTTEPNSYTIASKHPQWCTAMDEEFQALHKQGTWSLVSLPPHKNVVGCKWVYKLKYNSDGTIARYKARLVAKGFSSTLDVKNAFLHGALKEEVYMTQPQGYIDSQHPSHVCKLLKSIYGLKQAPRAWFESFTSQLLHLGFSASTADSSLFIYKNDNIIAYLLLYVDDIVLTSNTPSFLDHLIAQLNKIFDLKDLGQLHYFLGLQVTRTSAGLHLNQAKYASDLLKKHNMMDSKPAKTPSCPNTRLSLHEGDPLPDPHAYRSLVGALHYLTFTRPDISFSVHQVCQYMSAPTTIHFAAAKRILRYLRGTLFHGIAFHPGPLTLSAYTDADWAGDPDDRRSTSGYLVYLGSNPITWSAKKQPTVSRSSTESEYRALAIASAELCWIRALLKDLGIYLSQPPLLWCDNVSALAIASNPVFHARTKHIEVDFHFVRERVLRKDLIVKFVSTIDQLADIFTKSLPTQRFLDLQSNLTVSVPAIEGG